MLSEQGLPYKSIILTGGASRMPFVKTLCDTVFGQDVAIKSNPSHSVSKGLCFAGELDQKLPELLQSGLREMHTLSDEDFIIMENSCVTTITSIVYNCMVPVIENIASNPTDITISQLKDKMTLAFNEALSKNNTAQDVSGDENRSK